MGKKKDKGEHKADKAGRIPKRIAGFKVPKALRHQGEALIDKAGSAEGQAAIAKGLTVAAGLATMAAERTKAARAARPQAAESAEGATPSPAAVPPVDPVKVVEAVHTVANEVLGRLFGARKG